MSLGKYTYSAVQMIRCPVASDGARFGIHKGYGRENNCGLRQPDRVRLVLIIIFKF